MTANPPSPQEYKWLYFLISLAVLVNFSGLFVPLMDPDAGVYATLSKNMVLRHDFVNLYFRGADWLDKPHFQFWVSALFFKIFGIHDWSYKLAGISFVLLGAFYTYIFAKKYYNDTIALWAVFILLTSEHLIISNNDVRAESILIGLVMGAVWHFANSINKRIGWHLVLGSIFTACAVMTKGLFTLVPIGAAIGIHLVIKGEWKEIFNLRWLLAMLLIAVLITPELYCLWYQFDSHPEKHVFGKTGVSGIRFFLWDSQFGRFSNSGPIKGNGDISFFLHTLLWAFLPWSVLMYASIVDKIRSAFDRKHKQTVEWITIAGSMATLIVFSVSKFQLPHYTNIIFPFLSILTASYLWKIKDTSRSVFRIVQYAFIVVLLGAGILVQFLDQPPSSIAALLAVAFVVLVSIALTRSLHVNSNLTAFYMSGLAAIALNFYLNLAFYPDLLKYQSGNQAALFVNRNYPHQPMVCMSIYAAASEFYLRDSLIVTDTSGLAAASLHPNYIWFVTENELELLNQKRLRYQVLKEFPHYNVTRLSLKFLDRRTRQSQLTQRILLKFI